MRAARTRTQTPLANYRRARSITQEQLAKLIGVSQQSIGKAERGILRFSPDVQARLATILGVSQAELFPEEAEVMA